MDFRHIIEDLKKGKIAARRFEKSGNNKFRDLVTVCSNGKLRFERYCYGEAASLVCTLWAEQADSEGVINWDLSTSNYSGKTDAPSQLTGISEGNLLFDGKEILWKTVDNIKYLPEAGLGRLRMLFV